MQVNDSDFNKESKEAYYLVILHKKKQLH